MPTPGASSISVTHLQLYLTVFYIGFKYIYICVRVRPSTYFDLYAMKGLLTDVRVCSVKQGSRRVKNGQEGSRMVKKGQEKSKRS